MPAAFRERWQRPSASQGRSALIPGVSSQPPADRPEFIFGALSTEDGRLREVRLERAGQEIPIRVRVGAELAVAAMEGRYGVIPLRAKDRPEPPKEERLAMALDHLAWNTLSWGMGQEWSACLPGQPAGATLLKASMPPASRA
jgi:hypothetical protein